MTPTQLDPLLGQTYLRKETGKSGVVYRETYACVIKLTLQDSQGFMYNQQYNELALTWNKELSPEYPAWLCLTVYSIDDGWWRAILPCIEQDLFLLWTSIVTKITPTINQLWDNNHTDNWYAFTHSYFLQITKELGATEYDYG
jgi:crotonobetainyl-CoA:carnitine CoA-transferase CaiB-like acyl-CoA transferase